MFKSLLSILFTDILFPVYVFVCASLFLWLVPDYWLLLTFIAIGVFIIVHPIIFGRFDKYD